MVSDLESESASCYRANAHIDVNKALSVLDDRPNQVLTERQGALSNQLLKVPGSPFHFQIPKEIKEEQLHK